MNRIDRLSAMLIQLQSRRVVKAQDMAERFSISLRTVYRDIRALEEAGIPLLGEAGQGYSLADGYRLPPVMFTREEATAFITAEKLVGRLTDDLNGASYASAMYKIKAVLKSAEKDYLAEIDGRIEVFKSQRPPEMQSGVHPLQVILAAIAQKQTLHLKYFSYYRQQHTERTVEPLGVFYLDNYWHLIGWCNRQSAYRDFRFDRIQDIQLTEQTCQKVHLSLKAYFEQHHRERDLQQAVITIDRQAALHLGEQKYYHGYIGETETADGSIEMTFLTSASIEGFARWYVCFADCARILQPEALRCRVNEILTAAVKKLQVAESC